jgi:hypothetical protein
LEGGGPFDGHLQSPLGFGPARCPPGCSRSVI